LRTRSTLAMGANTSCGHDQAIFSKLLGSHRSTSDHFTAKARPT
jgi:hypothetical protein